MRGESVVPENESPGCAVGAAAGRATRDKMQRQILHSVRTRRKELLRAERAEVARRCGGLQRHAQGCADPMRWAHELTGWRFTAVQAAGAVLWYVRPSWAHAPVRVGGQAELTRWLAAKPGETFGDWYARIRAHLFTAGIRQGLVVVDEVGA